MPLTENFDVDGLIALRGSVATHATRLGMTSSQAEELVLIVQELAANAVRHGAGHGRLRLWRDGDRIHCQVSDAGPARDDLDRIGRQPMSPSSVGGRGLWLVRQFSHDLRIDVRPDGTEITAMIDLTRPLPNS